MVSRIERNNYNGDDKQIKLDFRKKICNERVKERQKYLNQEKAIAVKELVEKGELNE
jgi:hypothetical protein